MTEPNTGQVNRVHPRKLTSEEKTTIKELFKLAQKNTHLNNAFDAPIPGTTITIKDALREYIYYAPETGNNKGGYFYEKIDPGTGEFKNTVYIEKAPEKGKRSTGRVVPLIDLVDSPSLEEWLDSMYHQVRNVRLTPKSRNKAFVRVEFKDGNFSIRKFRNYQEYLLDRELSVLQTTLPRYSEDPSQPQKKNPNIYFDYNNMGIDSFPSEEKSEVPATKTKPKPRTRG